MTVPLAAIREAARQAGYPKDKRHLIEALEREGAERAEGLTTRGQRGFLYELMTLPAKLRAELAIAEENGAAQIATPKLYSESAKRRSEMVYRAKQLRLDGHTADAALVAVATEYGCCKATVKNALKAVRDVPESQWLDALERKYGGGAARITIPDAVWAFYDEDYGREDQPPSTEAYRRTTEWAANNGFGPIPSIRTFQRRWLTEHTARQRKLRREGEEALDEFLPFARCDRTGMKPNDCWNCDVRKADILVEWPDGTISRPCTFLVHDEASDRIVAHDMDKTENSDLYRRVIVGAILEHGRPLAIKFDHTRAAENYALTGGVEGHIRLKKQLKFKGILPRIGIKVIFVTPYNGKSKLVERKHLSMKRCETDPRLSGAGTGSSTSKKPANYGDRVVPLALFKEIFAEYVRGENSRISQSTVTNGISPDAVHEAGSKNVRKRLVLPSQNYLLWPAFERKVTPRGFVILGKRPFEDHFGNNALEEYCGKSVVIYRDPDKPNTIIVETPASDIAASKLIEVPIFETRPRNSHASAVEFRKAHNAQIKAEREVKKQNKRKRDALLGKTALPSAPIAAPAVETKVIQGDFDTKPRRERKVRDQDAIDGVLEQLSRAG